MQMLMRLYWKKEKKDILTSFGRIKTLLQNFNVRMTIIKLTRYGKQSMRVMIYEDGGG